MPTDENKVQVIGKVSGGTLVGIIFLILLVLKLMGKTKISWVWVFAPLWIPLGIWLLILLVTGLMGGADTEGLKTKDTVSI